MTTDGGEQCVSSSRFSFKSCVRVSPVSLTDSSSSIRSLRCKVDAAGLLKRSLILMRRSWFFGAA